MTADPGRPEDADDPPRWLRLLEPFRTEEAMFRVLLYALAVFAVLTAAVLLARAIF
jgi:hypothetical protein